MQRSSTTTCEIARHWAVLIRTPAAAAENVHVCFDKKTSLAVSYLLSSKSMVHAFFDPNLYWNRIKKGVSKYTRI